MKEKQQRKQKPHGEIVFQQKEEPTILDLKDKKILAVLAKNSRTPFTTIGKIVGLSQENVLYRMNRLKEKDIIVDFFTAIDSRKLGILSFVVFIKFSKISKDKEDIMIKEFLKNEHISWVTTTAGQFDMMIFVQAMDIYEFEKEWQKIMKIHGQNFSETEIAIMTMYCHSPAYYPVLQTKKAMQEHFQHLPYEKEFQEAKQQKKVIIETAFDTKDLEIIKELLINSRIKLTELGQKIGMSSQNVDVRIKQLIKHGIIQSFGYRPNYQKLQYQYYTMRLKAVTGEEIKKEKLQHYLITLPQTFYYFRMIGHWTYSIHMFYKDVRELNTFLAELREQYGDIIESYDSTIHFDQYYYTYIAPSSYRALKWQQTQQKNKI
jgi:Lrp/AsnC family transcriptional regulator for asnA, asnC and gidA